MAEIGGYTSDWQHGTAGAPTVLTDFSAKTQNVTMEQEMEEKEFQVFQSTGIQYLPGNESGTIEVEYIYDTALNAQLSAIKSSRAPVNFQLSPLGTSASDPRDRGEMIMTNLSKPVESGEIIILSVTWRITGEVDDTPH
jgi:hypothetical protein